MTALMAVCGAAAGFGLVIVVAGLTPRADQSPPARSLPGLRDLARTHRAALVRWLVGGLAGLVAFALTGWLVLLPVGPVAVVGLPYLLASPPTPELDLLRALDRWVRSIATMLPTGRSIIDAIRLSVRHAPEALVQPLELLVLRLDERWPPADALRAFADQLDSPDADAVVAALILAAKRGGTGATATLTALSDAIQERLRAMRDIEAERAKPRVVVRQVTVITLVVLAGALVIGGRFFAPYGTPVGQVVLAVLLGVYVVSLVLLRRMTMLRSRERILRGGVR